MRANRRGTSGVKDGSGQITTLSIDLGSALRKRKPTPVRRGKAGARCATITLRRSRRYPECLNDALIFLTAAKAGIPVLTANRDEFDLIQQLAPAGRFIHY
jgi:hypothetical protein